MPRSRKNKAKHKAAANNSPAEANRAMWQGETRIAEIVTVGWLFAALGTSLGLIAAIAAFVYVLYFPPDEAQALMLGYIHIVVLTMGALTLVLGWWAHALRVRPAPAPVRRATTMVGVLPWVIWLLLTFSK
jgi:hypothetical protein